MTDFVNHNVDTVAENSLNTQYAYMAQWKRLDAKADITVVRTIAEAIEFAKNTGHYCKGALMLVTGSLRLVGGALSILEPGNST